MELGRQIAPHYSIARSRIMLKKPHPVRFYEASLSPRGVKNLELKGNKEVAWLARETQHFINLRYLTIWSTDQELPEAIAKLETLWELTVLNCAIGVLPPWISKLKKLKQLTWRGSAITRVPDFVWQMNYLVKLDLGNNLITEISPEIAKLDKLNYLSVSNNCLRDFPLLQFPKIKHLSLINNPYPEGTWERIARYYGGPEDIE